MTRMPPPEAAIFSGPVGIQDPHGERLREAQRVRMVYQARSARRWQRWSQRLSRLARTRSEAAAVLRARSIS
ncbi:hypothetical protein [Phytoactinopolyspora halotolerans]|uniref:Uncharacterized protein n=1 Tax=Phytoactinopolyspora halotolerans TaxID=1981512 RepID=A0A6L9SGV4_9ACTN|nr:hypothetical protein [Phytoactinopolyspora halotolerans]NEE03652.1 hypothetical protein [Phytoactinopolyspora halotolerans]